MSGWAAFPHWWGRVFRVALFDETVDRESIPPDGCAARTPATVRSLAASTDVSWLRTRQPEATLRSHPIMRTAEGKIGGKDSPSFPPLPTMEGRRAGSSAHQ